MDYPVRINKYLALQGYCTRRAADELIEKGCVSLNGQAAHLGDRVNEGDTVLVRGNARPDSFVYLAFHKPKGMVTHGAQGDEVEIADSINKNAPHLNVFPVGRLDKNSTGLILLTNDGRVVEPLLSPDREHEKTYVVTVNERLRSDAVERLAKGVDIGGYVTKPCTVVKRDRNTFLITLTEGKHHQIKRMTSALGYTVNALHRIRIMNVRLGRLRPNTFRHIRPDELLELFSSLGLPAPTTGRSPRPGTTRRSPIE